jgi:hypothetical protein
MCHHRSDPARQPVRDLTCLALAVDALTLGSTWPTFVHVDLGPEPSDRAAIVEIGLTPLPGAENLTDAMAALDGWCAPRRWYVVGVTAPATLRSTDAGGHLRGDRAAIVVHLVGRRGERATRLSVPDAPRLSGPTDGFPVDSPLDRCLQRVLGGTT